MALVPVVASVMLGLLPFRLGPTVAALLVLGARAHRLPRLWGALSGSDDFKGFTRALKAFLQTAAGPRAARGRLL
jgi:hypothetical protein